MRPRPAARLALRLAALVLPLALAGCSMVAALLNPILLPKGRIRGEVPAPAAAPIASQGLRVGAARVDLTPIPGIPMAYSLDGKVSRGFWTRLYARAIYVEDAQGGAIALVSCDLPHIPNGFGDRVAELAGETPGIAQLGRAQIILAATHSHHSPQNFFSDKYYNSLPSPRSGFDPELFEFLARRITTAILDAATAKRFAVIEFRQARLDLFFRNRSLLAFLRNPESEAFLQANAAVPNTCELAGDLPDVPEHQTDGRACRAVRALVDAVDFVDPGGARIASAIFLAAHPTVLSPDSEVYSGDVFGVASALVEQERLGECASYDSPVVALFNGAQGDVSVTWHRRDRFELLNTDPTPPKKLGLAVQLAKFICQDLSATPPVQNPAPSIAIRFAWLPLEESLHAEKLTPCQPWHERCTVEEPISGAAAMGGAQDGRTLWYELGTRDGLRSASRGPHGRKAVGVASSGYPTEIAEMLTGEGTPPQEIPLGVYQIGNLVFATLPGEFTTMMGERIRKEIDRILPGRQVVLIGLANGRLSYVTTSEEYDAQFYEGGQNLYGAATGPLIESKLAELAGTFGGSCPGEPAACPDVRSYRYEPGICRVFLPREAGSPGFHADDGLQNILQDLAQPDQTKRDFPMACWIDAIPRLPDGSNACQRAVPYVWVEPENTENPAAQCTQLFGAGFAGFMARPCDRSLPNPCTAQDPRTCIGSVPQDNCGLDVVTVLHGSYGDRTRWCAFWMPSGGVDPTTHVLCAAGVTGANVRQAGGVIASPGELLGANGLPEEIDDGPQSWLGRFLTQHAECCGHATRPVCEYP
jgi:neutral ceramidase